MFMSGLFFAGKLVLFLIKLTVKGVEFEKIPDNYPKYVLTRNDMIQKRNHTQKHSGVYGKGRDVLRKGGLLKMNNINYAEFYKSIVDQDRAAVVICNLEHEIIYMNQAAEKNYEKWGGGKLVGKSLLNCHNQESREKLQRVLDWFLEDESHNIVYTFYNEKQNKDVYIVALRNEGKLIGYYEKHEYRNAETMTMYDLW
jgi:PAS domain-containing protein